MEGKSLKPDGKGVLNSSPKDPHGIIAKDIDTASVDSLDLLSSMNDIIEEKHDELMTSGSTSSVMKTKRWLDSQKPSTSGTNGNPTTDHRLNSVPVVRLEKIDQADFPVSCKKENMLSTSTSAQKEFAITKSAGLNSSASPSSTPTPKSSDTWEHGLKNPKKEFSPKTVKNESKNVPVSTKIGLAKTSKEQLTNVKSDTQSKPDSLMRGGSAQTCRTNSDTTAKSDALKKEDSVEYIKYEMTVSPIAMKDMKDSNFWKIVNTAMDCVVDFSKRKVILYFGDYGSTRSAIQRLGQVTSTSHPVLAVTIQIYDFHKLGGIMIDNPSKEGKIATISFMFYSNRTENLISLTSLKDKKRSGRRQDHLLVKRLPKGVTDEMLLLLYPHAEAIHRYHRDTDKQLNRAGPINVLFEDKSYKIATLDAYRKQSLKISGHNEWYNFVYENFNPRYDLPHEDTKRQNSNRGPPVASARSDGNSRKRPLVEGRLNRDVEEKRGRYNSPRYSSQQRNMEKGPTIFKTDDYLPLKDNIRRAATERGLDAKNADVIKILEMSTQLEALQKAVLVSQKEKEALELAAQGKLVPLQQLAHPPNAPVPTPRRLPDDIVCFKNAPPKPGLLGPAPSLLANQTTQSKIPRERGQHPYRDNRSPSKRLNSRDQTIIADHLHSPHDAKALRSAKEGPSSREGMRRGNPSSRRSTPGNTPGIEMPSPFDDPCLNDQPLNFNKPASTKNLEQAVQQDMDRTRQVFHGNPRDVSLRPNLPIDRREVHTSEASALPTQFGKHAIKKTPYAIMEEKRKKEREQQRKIEDEARGGHERLRNREGKHWESGVDNNSRRTEDSQKRPAGIANKFQSHVEPSLNSMPNSTSQFSDMKRNHTRYGDANRFTEMKKDPRSGGDQVSEMKKNNPKPLMPDIDRYRLTGDHFSERTKNHLQPADDKFPIQGDRPDERTKNHPRPAGSQFPLFPVQRERPDESRKEPNQMYENKRSTQKWEGAQNTQAKYRHEEHASYEEEKFDTVISRKPLPLGRGSTALRRPYGRGALSQNPTNISEPSPAAVRCRGGLTPSGSQRVPTLHRTHGARTYDAESDSQAQQATVPPMRVASSRSDPHQHDRSFEMDWNRDDNKEQSYQDWDYAEEYTESDATYKDYGEGQFDDYHRDGAHQAKSGRDDYSGYNYGEQEQGAPNMTASCRGRGRGSVTSRPVPNLGNKQGPELNHQRTIPIPSDDFGHSAIKDFGYNSASSYGHAAPSRGVGRDLNRGGFKSDKRRNEENRYIHHREENYVESADQSREDFTAGHDGNRATFPIGTDAHSNPIHFSRGGTVNKGRGGPVGRSGVATAPYNDTITPQHGKMFDQRMPNEDISGSCPPLNNEKRQISLGARGGRGPQGRDGPIGGPPGRGGPIGTPSGRGGPIGAPSGRGGPIGAPSGRGGPIGVPSGRGGPIGAPSGRGGSVGPLGRGDSIGAPSGRGGPIGAPSGRGGPIGGPSGRVGPFGGPPERGGPIGGPPKREGPISGPPGRGGPISGQPRRGGPMGESSERGGSIGGPPERGGSIGGPPERGGPIGGPPGRGGPIGGPPGRGGPIGGPPGRGGPIGEPSERGGPMGGPSERGHAGGPSERGHVGGPSRNGPMGRPLGRGGPIGGPPERGLVSGPSERDNVGRPSERGPMGKPSERGPMGRPFERSGPMGRPPGRGDSFGGHRGHGGFSSETHTDSDGKLPEKIYLIPSNRTF